MKTKQLFCLITGISLLTSCSDEMISQKVDTSHSQLEKSDFVYPNSKSFKGSLSRSGSTFETDWENFQQIPLPNGKGLNTPWGDESVGDLDESVKDIKKEDGWTMVLHTFNSVIEEEMPYRYMIFYNQITGWLKVFYYHTDELMLTNNGFWQVKFDEDFQALMNTSGNIAIPSSYRYNPNRKWTCSMPETTPARTLGKGWNTFTMPLAYDPNISEELTINIGSYASSMASMTLDGYMSGEMNGSIISDNTSNPFSNMGKSLATVAGKKASELAEKKFGADAIVRDGVKGLVEAGVSNLFNTVTGSFSKSKPKVQQLNLSIQMRDTLSGVIKFDSPTGVPHIRLQIGERKSGLRFGAWNLEDNPIIYIHPVGVLRELRYGGTLTSEHEYDFCASGDYLIKPVINPQLESHIIKYWTTCEPIYYVTQNPNLLPQTDFEISDYGTLGDASYANVSNIATNKLCDNDGVTLYDNKLKGYVTYWNIWDKYGKSSHKTGIYKYIYAPSNNDLCRGGKFRLSAEKFFVKVKMYMVTEFEGKRDTTVEMRTYTPKFEWDPKLCKEYGSSSMQNLQSYAEYDPILRKIDKQVLENYPNN